MLTKLGIFTSIILHIIVRSHLVIVYYFITTLIVKTTLLIFEVDVFPTGRVIYLFVASFLVTSSIVGKKVKSN